MLNVSGYPRSGQVFLLHAISLLLGEGLRAVNHSTKNVEDKIAKNERVLIPFRNPLDAVASWNLYQKGREGSNITSDLKYYIRYNSFILDNVASVTLLDFDTFTNDVQYIAEKIDSEISGYALSVQDVKSYVTENGFLEKNLPNDKKAEALEAIRAEVLAHDLYPKCQEIYGKLKQEHDNKLNGITW